MMALAALLPFLSFSSPAHAFETGFNQGWVKGNYGTHWVSNFDERELARLLDLTKAANGSVLRLWLFEGFQSDALLWENGHVTAVNPVFLANLRKAIQLAKARGVKLNLTLFDGNMATGKPPTKQHEYFWWALFNEMYDVREKFLRTVWAPVLGVLNEPELIGTVSQLDVANEINALTRNAHAMRFNGGWAAANRFVCAFKNLKDLSGARIPLTASVGWNNAADLILNGSLYPGCVDFFDVHVYDDRGEIPRCHELAQYGYARGKKVQLGEFGQSRKRLDDYLQESSTRAFLKNAEACGLHAAYAWRLSEPESSAYLSFERNGVLRPAYRAFQSHR